MIIALIRCALAQDAPWEAPIDGVAVPMTTRGEGRDAAPRGGDFFGLHGVSIAEIGGQTGLRVGSGSVVGVDGGTHAFTAEGQVRFDRYKVQLSAPYAVYRTADGRRGDLGNLSATASLIDDQATPMWQVSATLTVRTGAAWTWVNDAAPLWPENGLDVAYQRQLGEKALHAGVRTALGLHLPAGWEPYPRSYAKVDLAALVEQDLGERAGLIGEASLTWWDVSPVDLSVLARFDPAERARIRAGLTLPVASWAGWQPAAVPSGAREATLRVELVIR
jgi:hypothetical protein